MNKMMTIAAIILVVAAVLCGMVLTALQDRVVFDEELKNWYTAHADELMNEDWLLAHGFEKSDVLSAHADAPAYYLRLSTAGGYSTVTVFACEDGEVSFKAKSDILSERFAYQYAVWLGEKEHVWINIHADSKHLANEALPQVIEALQ